MRNHFRSRHGVRVRCVAGLLAAVALAAGHPTSVQAQIKAQARSAPSPAWSKGILPISQESYYNAIECGKQGGEDPRCVFYDTGLCNNDNFATEIYTPYKSVAYEVWRVVRQKQPAPQPNYVQAQQTRITVGVTPVRGSTNTFNDLVLKRGTRVVAPTARSLSAGGGRFTYDFPAFAPTGAVTLELAGKTKTLACTIDQAVLAQFR